MPLKKQQKKKNHTIVEQSFENTFTVGIFIFLQVMKLKVDISSTLPAPQKH